MDPYGDGKFPGYDDPGMNAAWIAAHRAMSQEDRAEAMMLYAGRSGIRTALRFSDLLTAIPASTVAYPDTTLGAQLSTAVRLLRAGAGIRVIHVPFSGDFDTFEDHLSRHSALMTELDGALDAFLQELAGLNLTQNVLLATTSGVRAAGRAEQQRARPRHRDRGPARRRDPRRGVRPAPELDDARSGQRQPEVHGDDGRVLRHPRQVDGRLPRRHPRRQPGPHPNLTV